MGSETDQLRKELSYLLGKEKDYLERLEEKRFKPMGSEIDYTMGKIRAYERVLELLK